MTNPVVRQARRYAALRTRMKARYWHLITLNLTEAQIKGLKRLVDAKMYPNRSEAIRMAVRQILQEELPLTKK